MPRTGEPWTREDDGELRRLLAQPRLSPDEIATALDRDFEDVLTRIAFLTGQLDPNADLYAIPKPQLPPPRAGMSKPAAFIITALIFLFGLYVLGGFKLFR